VRFLVLELDGRTTLDLTPQRLYGEVMGQHAAVSSRPHAEPAADRRRIPPLRRLLLATVQLQPQGVPQLR
jgi:hypothetical protein